MISHSPQPLTSGGKSPLKIIESSIHMIHIVWWHKNYIFLSEMKKIQNKIDQESDEIKKKEYYSSSEYKMMERKKKKIGLARMKTKTVSFLEFFDRDF